MVAILYLFCHFNRFSQVTFNTEMRIFIDGLPVIFPYKLIFSEQEIYMRYLKKALDTPGHAILEMPTGTGKTVCLLSLLTAYLLNRTKYKRVIVTTISSSIAPELSFRWKRLCMNSRIFCSLVREKAKTRRNSHVWV